MQFKLKENGLIWENYAAAFGDKYTLIAAIRHAEKSGDAAARAQAIDELKRWAQENNQINDPEVVEYFYEDEENGSDNSIESDYQPYPNEDAEHSSDSFADMEDGFGEDENGMQGDAQAEPEGVVMSFDTSEPVEPEMHHEEPDEDDHERNEMVRSEIVKLKEFADRLHKLCDSADFEEWMVAKVTKAADYASDVYFRLSSSADFANSGHGLDEF